MLVSSIPLLGNYYENFLDRVIAAETGTECHDMGDRDDINHGAVYKIWVVRYNNDTFKIMFHLSMPYRYMRVDFIKKYISSSECKFIISMSEKPMGYQDFNDIKIDSSHNEVIYFLFGILLELYPKLK